MVNVEDAGIVLKQSNPSAGVPNIVIENLKVIKIKIDPPGKVDAKGNMSIIRYEGVESPVLPNTPHIDTWIMGNQVLSHSGSVTKAQGSYLSPSTETPTALKATDGNVFERSKPQYETSDKVLQITAYGVKNDGTGDQSSMINKILEGYKGHVIFFPAGVYAVANTVLVPPGTKMVGEGWSQIMGYGPKFSDETKPWPIIKSVYHTSLSENS